MPKLAPKTAACGVAMALLWTMAPMAQATFTLKVHTGRGQVGYDVNSTMIANWDVNVARSKTAAEMRANVLAQYPGLGMEFTLDDRVATYFPAKPAGK